jgi:hypothetical protein
MRPNVAARLAHQNPGSVSTPPIPPWISNCPAHLDPNSIDLNYGPLATFFQHLAQENTAKSRAILGGLKPGRAIDIDCGV